MTGRFLPRALPLVLAVAGSVAPGRAESPASLPPELEAELASTLAAAGHGLSDLGLAAELEAPDRWRSPLATRALVEPLAAEARVLGLSRSLLATRGRLAPLLATLVGPTPAGSPGPSPRTAPEARTALDLPASLATALDEFQQAVATAGPEVTGATSGIDAADRAFVWRQLLDPTHVEVHVEPDPEERTRLLSLAARVDLARMGRAAAGLAAALDRLVETLGRIPSGELAGVRTRRVPGPGGGLILGGIGPDQHSLGDAVIVDLGGDDRYLGEAATRAPWEGSAIRVIVDLSGHDQYLAGDVRIGGGFLGIGLLHDGGGDDLYLGPSGSLGSGHLGIGMAVDLAGNDTWQAPRRALGAAEFGVGLVFEGAGSDRYLAEQEAQAFAGAGGTGLLVDAAGHDVYLLSAGERDFRGDFFDGYGQGAAVGMRAWASGGVAGLIDAAGDDRYEADYWGQGVGYWYGLGFLVDLGGDDRYSVGRYGQGAGVHFAAGLLHDAGGDDRYQAKAVAQGMGYDFSLGWLRELSGHDRYASHHLSQGASFANGHGLLLEEAGDDAYLGATGDTQGQSHAARGFGGIGVLFDREGDDRYAPNGRSRAFLARGAGGVFRDRARALALRDAGRTPGPDPIRRASTAPSPARDPAPVRAGAAGPTWTAPAILPPAGPGPEVPRFPAAADSPQVRRARALLAEAAALDAVEKEPARRLRAQADLVRMGSGVAAFLASRLGTRRTHETLEAQRALEALGREAVPALLAAYPEHDDHGRRQVLAALQKLPDPRALPFLAARLEDPSPRIRAAAAQALGAVGGTSPARAAPETSREPASPPVVRLLAARLALEVMADRQARADPVLRALLAALESHLLAEPGLTLDSGTVDRVLGLLAHPGHGVRTLASRIVGTLLHRATLRRPAPTAPGDPGPQGRLDGLLAGLRALPPAQTAQHAALRALQHALSRTPSPDFPSPVREFLEVATRDPDPTLAAVAWRGLARLAPEAAEAELQRTLDPLVRSAIRESLRTVDPATRLARLRARRRP